MGKNPFGDALEQLLATTKIKEKGVSITFSDDINKIKESHLLLCYSKAKNKACVFEIRNIFLQRRIYN